ncbi:preprotein translocase subunit SecE [candidate division WOR-3 bacterium]|nr:preprotein translocase subunit SecE [candidate division WOR-3 bacterium]
MDKIKTLLREMKVELSRVSWPKRKELWTSTWIVIVFSLLLALFMWVLDISFSYVIGGILR